MSEDKKIGDMTLKELHQKNVDIGMKIMIIPAIILAIVVIVFWDQLF